MKSLDWNKLSDKDKKLISKKSITYILGPVNMSVKRIRSIYHAQKGYILFGCLKDEEIPGLEGSCQFAPLQLKRLTQAFKTIKKVDILEHFHKDARYIIKELKPQKVLFVNGSWSGPIHYKSMYWKAIDAGAKIDLISPFKDEREAKRYEKKMITENYEQDMFSERKRYSDRDIMDLTFRISRFSWDWIGQIGAILARDGIIKAFAWNRVLPYEAYQMHEGAPREKMQIPSQEMIETHLTNHAECEILEICRRKKISMKDAFLYINIFPCPICAKNLSRTDIKGIVYAHDHNLANDIGYKALKASGKVLKRLVI